MDKYPTRDFLHNIVIHNTLSICGKMAVWGTRDPRRVPGLYRLIGSRVVLIWWAGLGSFMRQARLWACTDVEPINQWVWA